MIESYHAEGVSRTPGSPGSAFDAAAPGKVADDAARVDTADVTRAGGALWIRGVAGASTVLEPASGLLSAGS
jgi:hypothetical protein